MAYKDSNYTVMIAIMHRHKRPILVLKLTLVVEIQVFCLPVVRALLRLSLPVQLLRKAHKDSDHTVEIAAVY